MDEGTVRMQAQMFALVAEMYAVNASIEGMKVSPEQYDENAYVSCQQELEGIASRLREEI